MPSRNFTDSEEKEIAKLYKVGRFSAKAIMRAYGYKYHVSFTAALKRQGVKIRHNRDTNRIYQVNHLAFDVIDNEEKAYWLGFIYADGSVSKRTLTIGLARKDRKQIEMFKKFIECEHPINDTSCKASHTDKSYKQSSISVTHIHLAKRLKQLGITRNRGNFQKTISNVPNRLVHHFIRGIVDGDGSFHGYKPGFNIVGQKRMLEIIRTIFAKEIGLNPKIKVYKHPTAKIHNLIYMGRPQCLKIVDYLYKNATVWMERKRDVVEGYEKPKPLERDEMGRFKKKKG